MWVAKDQNNQLGLFNYKPTRVLASDSWKDNGYWELPNSYNYDDNYMLVDNSVYPSLKWEDEPIAVELITKQELNILKERAKQAPTTPYMGY